MIHTPCLGQEVFPIIKNNKGIWVPIPVVMLVMRRTMEHLEPALFPTTTEYRFSNHSLDKKIGPLPNWVSADNFFLTCNEAIDECMNRNPIIESTADPAFPKSEVVSPTPESKSSPTTAQTSVGTDQVAV